MKNRSNRDPRPYPASPQLDDQLDEEELFRRAMAKVKPLVRKGGFPVPKVRRRKALENDGTIWPWDALSEMMDGKQDFQWHYSPGYVQGGTRAWDEELLCKLREGGFSVQAELDLHGLTRQEAKQAVGDFVLGSVRKRHTCIRIIHGKGKHSPRGVSVLKQKVPQWLSLKRTARYVVAFTSAPPIDGGMGALYVLLKAGAVP